MTFIEGDNYTIDLWRTQYHISRKTCCVMNHLLIGQRFTPDYMILVDIFRMAQYLLKCPWAGVAFEEETLTRPVLDVTEDNFRCLCLT